MKNVARVLGLSAAVFAATAYAAPASEDGGYIGAYIDQASSDYAGSTNPIGGALQLGYQANANFALEFQYGFFGNIAPVGSERVSGFNLAAVGIVPVSERFSVYGKLGVARIDTKISGSGIIGVNGTSADGTYSKTAPTYGLGAQVNLNPRLGVRFGVDRFTTGGTKDTFLLNNGTLTVLYIGLKFGM